MAKAPNKSAARFDAHAKLAAEVAADVNAIESELIRAQNALAEIQRRPVSREEVEARVDAFLASEAEQGRAAMIASVFALPVFNPNRVHIADALASQQTGFGVLVALFGRETVRAVLVSEALAASPGEPIDDVERERETSRLIGEIASLERARERLIRDAENAGIVIPRSEFADPAILLAPDEAL